MSWDKDQLPRPESDVAALNADMARWGYCLIDQALTEAARMAVRQRLDNQAGAERAAGMNTRYQAEAEGDDVNQWVYNLVNKGEEFLPLPMNPTVQAISRAVLGQVLLLSSFDAHITYPSNKEMPLHTDQWWMPQPSMPGEPHWRVGDMGRKSPASGRPVPADHPIAPPMVVNVMWMLSDFTVDNGATRLVPGSHLSGLQPEPSGRYDSVIIGAPAGTALAWEGRTWHAAGQNVTNQPRYGVVTLFAVPIVRQLTNFTYSLKPDVQAKLPGEMIELLGFKPWEGYGLTDDSNADFALPASQIAGRLGD